MIKWYVNDEVENSIHKTKRSALKEMKQLLARNYKYKDTLELIRQDTIKNTLDYITL